MFYVMVVSIAFMMDGQNAVLRYEHSQHFETQALCDSHLPMGLAEIKTMVNMAEFPIKEAKHGTFSPECVKGVEERGA